MIPGEELADTARRVAVARLRSEALSHGTPLEEVVNETVVHETRRLARAPADLRRREDRAFVRDVAATLGRGRESAAPALLDAIAERHAQEIAGHFDDRVHRFATAVLPIALARGARLQDVLAGLGMVAEGVPTTLAACELAARHRIEVPLFDRVRRVLYEGLTPRAALDQLLALRPGRDVTWA